MGCYQFGPYEATLIVPMAQTEGPAKIDLGLAVDDGSRTVVFLAAEISDYDDEAFMCLWDGENHINLGANQLWRSPFDFLEGSLIAAARHLDVDGPLSREWGLPIPFTFAALHNHGFVDVGESDRSVEEVGVAQPIVHGVDVRP